MGVAVPHQLAGWTPIGVAGSGLEQLVDWCFTAGVDFLDPFFDQTVDRCLQEPFRLLFRRRTSMAALAQRAEIMPGLRPSGLVFHTSRCGSTLVSQMLAHLPSVLVMAEPGPLGSLLAARSVDASVAEEQQRDWFRAMVAALGQPRRAEHRHFVIKFDAWAVLHLPFIRSAFPDVPAIFITRDPVEVLVSQLGHRGYHMIPGSLPPALLGLRPDQVTSLAPEAYVATVLARLLESVLSVPAGDRPALIDYRQLPGAVIDTIGPLFSIEIGTDERARLLDVASRDAKNPCVGWAGDTEAKRLRATDRLRAEVERLVQPLYESLGAPRGLR
jgi:hypothetical protein